MPRIKRPEIPAVCGVCCEPLEFAAIYPCNHVTACSLCATKLRLLANDLRCMQCQQEARRIIIGKHTKIYNFDSYFGNKKCIPESISIKEDVALKAYFVDWSQRDYLLGLQKLCCSVCDRKGLCEFPTLNLLKKHLKIEHGRYFCELCLEHKKVFLQSQTTYFPDSLLKHQNHPSGHPLCSFCNIQFYDDRLYYRHLRDKHEFCSICPPNKEEKDHHIIEDHYPCYQSKCSISPPQAFHTFQDLYDHTITCHGEQISESQFLKLRATKLSSLPYLIQPTMLVVRQSTIDLPSDARTHGEGQRQNTTAAAAEVVDHKMTDSSPQNISQGDTISSTTDQISPQMKKALCRSPPPGLEGLSATQQGYNNSASIYSRMVYPYQQPPPTPPPGLEILSTTRSPSMRPPPGLEGQIANPHNNLCERHMSSHRMSQVNDTSEATHSFEKPA